MTLSLAPLAKQHLSAVWQIEQQAHSHPWSKNTIEDLSSRGACHRVLLKQNEVVGYFYAQDIAQEMTLLNLAVDPKHQKQGYGYVLMQHFIELCQQRNITTAWLEVRASNQAAFSLYNQCGFHEIDRRLGYYPATNGREDALVMSLAFGW